MTDLANNFDDVIGSMPEPQEHAIAAEKAANDKPADIIGNTFNPDIHAQNQDGSPKLTATGAYAKKRGRKNGTKNQSTLGNGTASITQNSGQILGAQVAGLVFMMGQLVGGEEWAPRQDPESGANEFDVMSQAWGKYLEAKNMKDIPPGVMLAFVMAAYVGPRLFMPKTKTRLQKAKDWLVLKVYRRREKAQPDDKK
jgi:hypothetical protein